ncbi:MAG: hypothetical protein O7A06_10730 [Acidobacteria bacterium]|nr:hypothetical protein [Acidobacteriota bacterium]
MVLVWAPFQQSKTTLALLRAVHAAEEGPQASQRGGLRWEVQAAEEGSETVVGG